MDSYGLRYDRTLVQVSYVEEKFLKHFSYHLLVHWSPASRPAFLSYRKLRFYTIKNAPRQAENPAKQDSIFTAFHKMQHTSSPILPYPKRKRMRMP